MSARERGAERTFNRSTLPGPQLPADRQVSAQPHHAMTYNTSETLVCAGAPGVSPPALELFAIEQGEKTVAQSHCELPPAERALRAIERVLLKGHALLCAFSSGKDSSCVANLMFNAAINVIQRGHTCPQLVISHSDTGVESPVVRALADGELQKMRLFADKHGLPLDIRVGRPTLSACFATRVIGGRALPPFPQSRQDCSTDWKVLVAQRIINQVKKERDASGPAEPAIVTLIGTRSDESAARKHKTAARKETPHEIWYSATDEARLSPILDWGSDDVWEYLGECAAGNHLSYSDFQATMEFYSAAGGNSCVIVLTCNLPGRARPAVRAAAAGVAPPPEAGTSLSRRCWPSIRKGTLI